MAKMAKRDHISRILTHGVADVIDRKHLEQRLIGRKKLRIKFGIDPTASALHIGNAVPLWKLREFQDLGHTAVLIIGDTTAQIGDPSGRKKARPMLSEREIKKNARTWIKQAGKVLDMERTEVRRNSEWLADLNLSDIVRLASRLTVARLMERDDFAVRFRSGTEIFLHELLYPLMQAYDSVAVEADVEIGGTDQLFNLLAGRELQKKLGHDEQDIITLPLLIGTDGKEKMSKSVGNVIMMSDKPTDMFGKVMAVPDSLISDYALLAARWDEKQVKEVQRRLAKENPRDVKADIAESIVSLYRSDQAARRAREEFVRVFRRKEGPSHIPTVSVARGKRLLAPTLVAAGLATGTSEARRLITQGAVRVDGVRHEDWKKPIMLKKGAVIQVGKRRFVKIG